MSKRIDVDEYDSRSWPRYFIEDQKKLVKLSDYVFSFIAKRGAELGERYRERVQAVKAKP